MENSIWIYLVGFAAQILFSARLIIQWISSERAKKSLSPTIFWQLSLFASFLLFTYGWLIDDFAIILGQVVSYYIYIWNLNSKKQWEKLPYIIRLTFISIPILVFIYFAYDIDYQIDRLFRNENIPLWLLIFGSTGQIIFTLRFVYQWYYSKKVGESVLPRTFWIISLTGSLAIISYAIVRMDPVLIIGQSPGIIVYIRNLILSKNKPSC